MSSVGTQVVTPYKGLAPFEDSALDELLFFGRGRETEVIVANLLAAKLTVLYGPSGVGKSSIFRALGGEAVVGELSSAGLGKQTTSAARLITKAGTPSAPSW